MPPKGVDLEPAGRVNAQGFGSAKRRRSRSQIMMPRAGISVQLVVRPSVIGQESNVRPAADQRNPINPAAGVVDMFLEPPTQPAVEIQLPFFRAILSVPRQSIIARLVQQCLFQTDRVVMLAQISGV